MDIDYKQFISTDEADRRGMVYDQRQHTCLFDICQGYTLDAQKLGNVGKFLNHSDTPNCEARLMRCCGESHIGFYALNDIAPGEELLFDYKFSETAFRDYQISSSKARNSKSNKSQSQSKSKSKPKKNATKAQNPLLLPRET
jgi:SET domain-containing protein